MAGLLLIPGLFGELSKAFGEGLNDDVRPEPEQLQPVVRPVPAAPDIIEKDAVSPDYRPSLLLKAYAHALLPHMSINKDLLSTGQAFFVASPQQRGIPSKGTVYANEQLFQHANALQSSATPIFQSNRGNYFEWLNSYVTAIPDTTVDDPVKAAASEVKYLQLKAQAAAEFSKALENYEKVTKYDDTIKFQDFMDKYAIDYTQTCDLRDKAMGSLAGSDLRRSKQTLDSAQARLEYRKGNNMACSLQDFNVAKGKPVDQDRGDIIYRPLHFLSGYDSVADSWILNSSAGTATIQEIKIDLEAAKSRSWSSLGFPNFDTKPGTAQVDLKLPKDCQVVLRYKGLQAFDVYRGLWDITSPRTVLPTLPANMETFLHDKIYKTIRLLLGYEVSLVVKLTPEMAAKVTAGNDDDGGVTALFPELGDFPLVANEKNELVAGLESKGAYPVLLGVLTSKY